MPILTHNNTPPVPFPLYLFPSIPFRRRSSTTSTSTSTTHPSPSSSPSEPTAFLTSTPTSHLRCAKCLTDLLPTTAIISKGFTGRHGRAYLVSAPGPPASAQSARASRRANGTGTGNGNGNSASASVNKPWSAGEIPNTHTHKPVPRQLVTGAHTVSDISCRTCGSVLGWKYVEAEEETQRYKVGKYILETRRIVRGAGWEDGDTEATEAQVEGKDVEFDSQDEDECEDLFAGVWTGEGARRRRRGRRV